jgi:hypothetical protein
MNGFRFISRRDVTKRLSSRAVAHLLQGAVWTMFERLAATVVSS